MFTQQEQHDILGNVGGRFESYAQLVQSFVDGSLTPSQQKAFMDSIDGKLQYITKTEATRKAELFKKRFLGPGSGMGEDYRPNVINAYNANFEPFGMAAEDPGGEGATPGLAGGESGPRPEEKEEGGTCGTCGAG